MSDRGSSGGSGGRGRRFRLGRRQRSGEDPFPMGTDDDVDDDWLAAMGDDLRDGDDQRIPSPGPAPRRSAAAAVTEALQGLSEDIDTLEDKLSRLEETLSPPVP